MIGVRDIGGQKTIEILATGLYRWNLVVRGLGEEPGVLRNFLLNSVRWLSTRDEGKYVQASTNRQVYSSGETVYLMTHVYDQMYRPLDRARVNATLVAPSTTLSFQLLDKGDGQHEYAIQTLESGMYSVFIEAEIEGRSLGHDTTSFSVSTFNPEFLSTKANPDLLQNLAERTGGKSGPPDSLSGIVNSLIFPPEEVQSTREYELFNFPGSLVLLMILLCAEWFVRKRKGML